MLADLLSDEATKHWIVSYHEHTALLENIEEERLNETERKQAWEEYEAVKAGRRYGNEFFLEGGGLKALDPQFIP